MIHATTPLKAKIIVFVRDEWQGKYYGKILNMGSIDGVQTVFFRSHSSRRTGFDTVKFFRTSVIEVTWFGDLHSGFC